MKKILLVMMAMVFVMTCASVWAKDYEITKKAGDLRVKVTIDKNPPATGKNKITISVKDAADKPVTNATVSIDYGMPAMPGMGAMNYKTSAPLKGESYQAMIDFSMAGPWFINIKIAQNGKPQTVKLNVDIK